jgi:phosphatidylserine/phosphatidylglycerophosphate/cardiolipin synthase-like enzyme
MPAVFEPQSMHTDLMDAKKPWERQEGESARWFMRFRNYLSLGSKRSINGTFELERKNKQEKSRTNAGPEWYNAAKRYQWQDRAESWDRDQDGHKAIIMQAIAAKCSFVSRPFRIVQLNSLADTLMRETEKGQEVQVFLALTKQIQSLMHDIQDEIAAWGVPLDAATDAAALDAYREKGKRMNALQQEREEIADAEIDAMIAQLEKHRPDLYARYLEQ